MPLHHLQFVVQINPKSDEKNALLSVVYAGTVCVWCKQCVFISTSCIFLRLVFIFFIFALCCALVRARSVFAGLLECIDCNRNHVSTSTNSRAISVRNKKKIFKRKTKTVASNNIWYFPFPLKNLHPKSNEVYFFFIPLSFSLLLCFNFLPLTFTSIDCCRTIFYRSTIDLYRLIFRFLFPLHSSIR